MGLFDIVRDKVAELFPGASDKVNEITGAELPGAEAAEQLTHSADNLTDTAQGLSNTATDAVQDGTSSAADAANSAITDATDPHK